jgi:hypothetical protein
MVSSVVSRHFHVELTDSPVQSHVSELFVNVVGVISRLVLQGDSVSLHEVRVLFEYLLFIKFTSFTERTCPLALFILFKRLICFQNLDLAKTAFLANTRMA